MSCCPPAPQIVEGSSSDASFNAQDTQIRPGESVECYMKRAENPSGLKDDLTGIAPDKIANTSIPVGPNGEINVTFKLTPDSTRTPTTWTLTGALPTGVSFTPGGATATLAGTIDPADFGKPFNVTVAAADASDIDSRAFAFAGAKATNDNSIQFILPLPGAIVTSKFDPNRVHPVRKVVAPHKGVDLAIPGRKVDDVVAAADGEVVFCGFEAGGAGNYVKINHRSGSGALLCQTVYMHLEKFYVAPGQKVAAGQKIGREGNTGIGTGAHLHFECRLIKDGQTTWTDPQPYIRGSIDVANKTLPDNTADTASITTQNSNARITKDDADAKSGGCAPFGPTYPPDPQETSNPTPTPPNPSTDPFELAWDFTMKFEVGPHWKSQTQYSPGDPELDAGLKDTAAQRKKTGYVNHAGYPGGETKFGIAQGPNPSINVGAMGYDPAKQTGYNNYWLKLPSTVVPTQPKAAVMLFDMCYLHGQGNVKGAILPAANITGKSDADACAALNAAQLDFIKKIVEANPSRAKYQNGWNARANALYSYASGLPL